MKHKVRTIHFVGIGGVGMSGIAEVLLHLGYAVSGSDLSESSVLFHLRQMGATIFIGHNAAQINKADVVVASTAISPDNPEILAAQARCIPVIPRAMMLAELMRFRKGIAIAGTHGKTTTTSLVASILEKAGLDPTYVVGGKLTAVDGNAYLGKGDYLVAEADESDASFLYLAPMLAVVTNIDEDHMSTYGHNLDRLRQSFIDFLHRLPFYGRAVLCEEDVNVRRILPDIKRPVWLYGFSEHCHLRASHIAVRSDVVMEFIAHIHGEKSFPVTLNLPGRHNILNALAAIGIALELEIPVEFIQKSLLEFKGVGRRFQRYGQVAVASGGVFDIIDDYGHHPVEMKATLDAARGAFTSRRLVLIFQPHRYSRTKDLFREFVHVLSGVDLLVLTPVYSAGELEISGASSEDLIQALKAYSPSLQIIYQPDMENLVHTIFSYVQDDDVVLTMGAGSIGQIPGQIYEYRKQNPIVA